MIYILERMWSKFGHRLDFEQSKVLCEVIDRILRGQKLDVKSKIGLNLVQTWALGKMLPYFGHWLDKTWILVNN